MSFGVVAVAPKHAGSVKALVKMVEEALYAAKAVGRNQVQTSDHAD